MKYFFSILMLGLLFGSSAFLSSCAKEGPMGPAGPTGEAGEDGQDGDKGDKGDPGLPGADAQGNINSDTTWTAAGGPYTLEKNIVVKSEATLTIEPNTAVHLNPNTIIYIDGKLDAQGTASNLILFKKEGTVGGGQIFFTSTCTGSVLRYCELQDICLAIDTDNVDIQFCKIINSIDGMGKFAIWAPGANSITLSISNCTFIGNGDGWGVLSNTGSLSGVFNNCIIQLFYSGISLSSGNLTITNSSILNNAYIGISTYNFVIITGSNIYGSNFFDYYNQSYDDQTATGNYWGTTTPSEIDSKIFDKNDLPAIGTVDYSGYLSSPVTVTGCGW
jgi:hypothetical protein